GAMSFFGQVIQWFQNPAHWQGDAGIPHRTFEHLLMSGASVLTAALIALPVGIAVGHYGRGGILAITVSNVGRAIPSFAVLVLAAVVGWGGLGRFIVDGFGLQVDPMLFAGAVMVAVLSLIVEFSLAGVQRLSTPAGLRPLKSSQKEGPSGTAFDTAAVAA